MARNLQSQMLHCVSASFWGDENLNRNGGHGSSKHSDKINGTKAGKIYSHDTYNNRKEVVKEFGKFMKENFPEVKNVRDLTERHATAFVSKKSGEVSTNSLNNIRSQLRSFSENVNNTFKTCNINLDTPAMQGRTDEKVKDVSISNSDYKQLLNTYSDKLNDTGAVAVQVSHAAGLRAHEICKLKGSDITEKNGAVVVHVQSGKGGRARDVIVSDPERAQSLIAISEHYGDNKVCDIKPHSLEVNVSRHLKQIDSEKDYEYNSIHSLRKGYAQNEYDRLKDQGYSSKEAWGEVCKSLGHSEHRAELFKTYIDKA